MNLGVIGFLISLLSLNAFAEEDPYTGRIGDDFIENTTFRFRTKYNRIYTDPPPGEYKTIVSRRIDVPPVIDGILEDPCWKDADYTKSAFAVIRSKKAARKQTVIYCCHDDSNLYMAFVNEEPRLKTVRMLSRHPADRRSWTTAGRGDCIEAFLELGGVGGTGQIFQFIFNIYPQVLYDGLAPDVPFIETGTRLKGSFGAKRWIAELAFPYKGFDVARTNRSNFHYEGPPRRGEIWGLRAIREGPKTGTQAQRFVTTWTYNTTISNVIPFPTGIIVFEGRNALRNGRMNRVAKGTNRPLHWKIANLGNNADGNLSFDSKDGFAILTADGKQSDDTVLLLQKIRVLTNVGYKLKAKLKKIDGGGKVVVGVDQPILEKTLDRPGEWVTIESEFFTEPKQTEATVMVRVQGGSASVAIDEITVEQQIYGAPQNAVCLTGNSPRIDLNLEKKLLEKVRYTYIEPSTDNERFPSRKQWSTGWTNGTADVGGTSGWLPVEHGSLTSRDLTHSKIEWSHPRPSGGSVSLYPKGHEILFDLGRDYYIRTVELLPLVNVGNMSVSIKEEGSDKYILSRKLRGAGVLNPPTATLFGRLRRIDSVGRFVKLWFTPRGKFGHGMYFVRIWGEETKGRKGIKRFRWKEGLVVPEKKYQQFRKLEGPVLMPTPQEVEWGDGEFVVGIGMPVYFRPNGRGRAIAHHLIEEVEAAFGFKLRPIEEKGSETIGDAIGAIVLGDNSSGSLAGKLARQRGWKMDSRRPGPQGYFLSSSQGGVLICGFDQAGTFYGVQTLLQLLIQRDWQTAVARSVEVRDWPYIPWRMIDVRGPGSPTRAFIRALARLKVNVIMSNLGGTELRKLCDDYFMFTPFSYASHSGGSPIETGDDENWHDLGSGPAGHFRINACPSHYKRYEFYEGQANSTDGGAAIKDININTDEMDGGGGGSGGGARWLSDRRCLVRGQTGDELFTEMVVRAYDIFRLRHIHTSILDTMLMSETQGGNGSYYDMYKALNRIPNDIHLYSWRGFVGHPASNPELALRQFDRVVFLQAKFPFEGRGKLNQAYKALPGKRVWGIWNTVWGIAGPVDQVLTGQFCRSMRSVDGGAIIPFMCQGWNPDRPSVHKLDWVLKIGNFQQRLGEIALERELPSWRDGVDKNFFRIDLRQACNWSHIDPVPGDGKDWLDWGPNNDLRHLPRGDVIFEEIPFHVIDPAGNGGRSIIITGWQSSAARLRVPERSAEIPVGRLAASLVFLRTNSGSGHLPGYRVTYEGGRYLTIELDAMGNGSKGYSCYGIGYGPEQPSGGKDNPEANFKRAKHGMSELLSLFFRPAWLGTTGAGDQVKLTMHEWVNPYPKHKIESVSVSFPPGRTSGRLETLFAITGIAPEERDFSLWRNRKRLPLVDSNEVEIEPSDVPLFPSDGEWEKETEGPPRTWLGADGNKICEVTGFLMAGIAVNNRIFFKRRDRSHLANGGTIRLARPQVCKKVALRGLFYWESTSAKPHYGVTTFRRTDVVVEVTSDGLGWQKIGERKGICGEDGAHVFRLPAMPIQAIRFRLDGAPYTTARSLWHSSGPGLTWVQLYQ